VSEALWKRKAVVGGAAGGIKLQIIDGITGFLVHSSEGAATRIAQLLGDRRLRDKMGENGYQHVRQNFLVTRHVRDYILTMLALDHPGESMIYLA
jgi:trehalose synthase